MSPLSTAEILDLCRRYTVFDWSAQASVNPIAVDHAEGVYFWDTDGKRYLDFNSQLMNVNIGHGDRRVVAAIQEQAAKLCYTYPGHATEPRAVLGRLLAEVTPGDLERSFFTLGGTEANEMAIRIVRAATGRHKILARYRSFHGGTAGSMALTGEPRRWPTEPGLPGIVHFLDPFCYRCSFGQKVETCRMECVAHLEEVIAYEGPGNVAAVHIETVTGTNGIIPPPRDYLQRVRVICDRHGILLVCDEVMSGFGRCGEWFAVDRWGVVPDLLVCAKGLTSAYLPLGAVVMRKEIGQYFDTHAFPGGLTYGAHTLSCAAAIANIGVYREDGLIENARRMGAVMEQELAGLRARHRSVGDVRSVGLFCALEIVKDRKTREPMAPYNPSAEGMRVMAKFGRYLREHGLFTFVRWNIVHVNPPLCITEEQIRDGVGILDAALDITDAEATSTDG
jgi:taurine--2-oxoglutarate transaminase